MHLAAFAASTWFYVFKIIELDLWSRVLITLAHNTNHYLKCKEHKSP